MVVLFVLVRRASVLCVCMRRKCMFVFSSPFCARVVCVCVRALRVCRECALCLRHFVSCVRVVYVACVCVPRFVSCVRRVCVSAPCVCARALRECMCARPRFLRASLCVVCVCASCV